MISELLRIPAEGSDRCAVVEEVKTGKAEDDEWDDWQNEYENIDDHHNYGDEEAMFSLVLAGHSEEEQGVEVDDEIIEPWDEKRAADGGELNIFDFVAIIVILFDRMVIPCDRIAVQFDSYTSWHYIDALVLNADFKVDLWIMSSLTQCFLCIMALSL